jgi:hypothetical protein
MVLRSLVGKVWRFSSDVIVLSSVTIGVGPVSVIFIVGGLVDNSTAETGVGLLAKARNWSCTWLGIGSRPFHGG